MKIKIMFRRIIKLRFIFFLFLTFFFLSKNSDAIQFESLETKNGIKFWLIEDKTLPLVSISFSFKGGSILDPVGQKWSYKFNDIFVGRGYTKFYCIRI